MCIYYIMYLFIIDLRNKGVTGRPEQSTLREVQARLQKKREELSTKVNEKRRREAYGVPDFIGNDEDEDNNNGNEGNNEEPQKKVKKVEKEDKDSNSDSDSDNDDDDDSDDDENEALKKLGLPTSFKMN